MSHNPELYEYDRTAKWLHWLIAALVAIEFITAYAIPESRLEGGYTLRTFHMALGVLIIVLVVARLFWRFKKGVPPFPPSWDLFHCVFSRAIHYGFYVLLFVLPISGWVWVSSWSGTVSIFDLFTLTDIVSDGSKYGAIAADIHRIGVYVFSFLLLVHLAGSLYSYLFTNDHVMDRMLPHSARRHRTKR